VLYAGRHWKEALAAANALPVQTVDLGEVIRLEITGQSKTLANVFDKTTTYSDLGRNLRDPAVNLATYLMYMRINHRFDEAQQFLTTFPLQNVRGAPSAGGALPGLGQRPVDEYRAWLALLSGQPGAAAGYAKGVRRFVNETTETPWNAWFLRMLGAEADLFEGKKAAAIRATREALLTPPLREANVRSYRYRERMAATILAWAGDKEEAVKLLRSLAYEIPVIGASAIARDPFFSLPLAGNDEYRKLQVALEAEIATLL
jgi:hypothetical protein